MSESPSMKPAPQEQGRSTPTPGPWFPQRDTGLRWRIRTAGDKGTLAYMTARPAAWAGNFSHAQIEANANLIAAAPDLLAAVEWLVRLKEYKEQTGKDSNYQEAMPMAWESARAAIKKAKGL